MKKRKLILSSAIAIVLSLSLGLWDSAHVFADTFSVNSTGDTSDVLLGDGLCDDGDGNCTLRAAIEETNVLGGANTINFNIAGSGVQTITPGTDLPEITNGSLTIDGSTQPGSSCGTLVPASLPAVSNTQHTLLIELDATNALTGIKIPGAGP